MQSFPLDPRDFVRHIEVEALRFSRSARKHKVGRRRVRDVVAAPLVVQPAETPSDRWAPRVLVLGHDHTGRALEVILVLDENGTMVVIHAMDLRDKYRALYEEARREA